MYFSLVGLFRVCEVLSWAQVPHFYSQKSWSPSSFWRRGFVLLILVSLHCHASMFIRDTLDGGFVDRSVMGPSVSSVALFSPKISHMLVIWWLAAAIRILVYILVLMS